MDKRRISRMRDRPAEHRGSIVRFLTAEEREVKYRRKERCVRNFFLSRFELIEEKKPLMHFPLLLSRLRSL